MASEKDLKRVGGGPPEAGLELGEYHLDGVQIGAVRQQDAQLGTRRLLPPPRHRNAMSGEVVQHQGRRHPITAQGSDECRRLPLPVPGPAPGSVPRAGHALTAAPSWSALRSHLPRPVVQGSDGAGHPATPGLRRRPPRSDAHAGRRPQ